jgi:hypothetical protein
MTTRITEPICSTPGSKRKTPTEHMIFVADQLRGLGVQDKDLVGKDGNETHQKILRSMQALVKAQPYLHFRTWKGTKEELVQRNGQWVVTGGKVERFYPTEEAAKAGNPYVGREPRVVEEWLGATEYTPGEEQMAHTQDHSAPASDNGDPGATYEESAPDTDTSGDSFSEFGDLDSLVERAGADDDEAIETLNKMALSAGKTQQEVNDASSWDVVVGWIKEASPGGGQASEEAPSEEPEPDKFVPTLRHTYGFHPIDPKTKKPVKKAIEVQVTSLDKAKETCAFKSLDDPKRTWKDIAWSDLSEL